MSTARAPPSAPPQYAMQVGDIRCFRALIPSQSGEHHDGNPYDQQGIARIQIQCGRCRQVQQAERNEAVQDTITARIHNGPALPAPKHTGSSNAADSATTNVANALN